MARKDDTTDESSGEQTQEWFEFKRRPLLKALGAGSALSLGTGMTAAAGCDSDDGSGEESDEQEGEEEETSTSTEISRHFGYSTFEAGDIPDDLDPDHEIELLAAPPDPASGQPPLLIFDPVGLHVDTDDVVRFTFASPDHTVTAMHPDIGPGPRVPEESPPFSSPVMGPGAAWLYRFEHEGVYDLYCAPHQLLGMVMRLVVGDLAEEDVPDYARSVEGLPTREQISQQLTQFGEQNEGFEWPFVTMAEVLGADSLAPMNVQERGAVPFGTVAEELGYQYPPPSAGDGAAPTVQVHDHDEYGEILVGPEGMTVYMFDQDAQGEGESSCYDSCASLWPPLTVEGEPAATDDVAADLATFERETGEMQVTANGWPLYYFAQDSEPGDAQGQGANDVWWVLRPDGTPVRD